jgi:hypothetical protein
MMDLAMQDHTYSPHDYDRTMLPLSPMTPQKQFRVMTGMILH